ncbi:MAG TPA: hypothetical protein VF627_12545 [Abditibacterium sp.]|jgi:hypothetical protein
MRFFSRLALLSLLLSLPAWSQTPKLGGNSSYSGNLTVNANGVRLDTDARGPARVTLPQLDVAARSIALDRKGNAPPTQIRAVGSVNFKLNVTPTGGTPTRVEATCDNATLTPRPLKLVLRGNLKGFYQVAGGARNTLAGDTATFTNTGGNLIADLTGGVTLVVPAQTLGQEGVLGEVTISAQRAQINENSGTATFAGNARAVSSGGTNAFDVSAPRFTLTRAADNSISSLQTIGRTLVKLDLPPDPAPATPAAAPAAAPATGIRAVGQPTHVEVAADGAILEPASSKRASSIATFDGNVKGFYRLTQGAAPQNYDFVGTRAVIRYAPTRGQANALAGFNLEVSDATVGGPPFDLEF